MDLLFIFFTGLTTGGLSCLAVQGGLLASVIANQKDQEREDLETAEDRSRFRLGSFDALDWMPVAMFLSSKLVAHTILGFLLGVLGSAITLSVEMRLVFQAFTGLFMFATAMNLLDVHPIFRFVAFQPPRFIQRLVRNSSKSKALFAPAVLGFMTIFIPCGVTQAMEVLAINTGNPIMGAAIMFAFVLGTMPLFAILGVATAKLSEGWYQLFTKVASLVLIGMALYSINGVLVVLDSPFTYQNIMNRPASDAQQIQRRNGVQDVTIQVENYGYSPDYIQVQAGVPVRFTLESDDTYSCALDFVFREFGIRTFLESTDSQSFTFTPEQRGSYTFACSMGMYNGTMEVL